MIDSESFNTKDIIDFKNSLLDTETVQPNEVHNHGVVISVPLLYISTDEIPGNDKIISNLRVIKYDLLSELLSKAVDIGKATNEESMELCETFVKYMMNGKSEAEMDPNMKAITDFLTFTGKIAKEMDVDDEYIDVTTEGISFDVIRNYICHPETGILMSAEPTMINGIQLYSQLSNDNDILMVRQQTNDTDFMRMQYYLSQFEKILAFKPGYVYNKTMKLANLTLFYLCIIDASKPIDKMCSVDLKANMIGFMIDLIVRSRVIQAWQRDESSRKLLNDMNKNHDSDNPIIQICKMSKASQRAQYVLNLLGKQRELQEITQSFTYEMYEKLLKDFEHTVDGHTYYCFNSQFITAIATNFPIFDALKTTMDKV